MNPKSKPAFRSVNEELEEQAKTDPKLRANMERVKAREREEERLIALAEAQREQREAICTLMGRGVGARHAEILVKRRNELIETEAMKHVRKFLADPDARSLVLAGPPGLGKTLAASWLVGKECPDVPPDWKPPTAQELRYAGWEVLSGVDPIERSKQWPYSLYPRMVAAAKLIRILDDEERRPFECCSMLVLDDLGDEHIGASGWGLSVLDSLINARYVSNLRTVITTNLDASHFVQRYGERVADRIREAGEFVGLTGESLRRKGEQTDHRSTCSAAGEEPTGG